MNNVLGKRIRELISSSKLSQRDLAQDIGVTESAISKYLSGERMPRGEILLNLVTALNTTSDYLLGHTDYDNSNLSFNELKGILSRNSTELNAEQKTKLIEIIINQKN